MRKYLIATMVVLVASALVYSYAEQDWAGAQTGGTTGGTVPEPTVEPTQPPPTPTPTPDPLDAVIERLGVIEGNQEIIRTWVENNNISIADLEAVLETDRQINNQRQEQIVDMLLSGVPLAEVELQALLDAINAPPPTPTAGPDLAATRIALWEDQFARAEGVLNDSQAINATAVALQATAIAILEATPVPTAVPPTPVPAQGGGSSITNCNQCVVQ